jgi:DNA polymerase III subunit chi
MSAEVWFYELAREPVDRVLPGLLYRHHKRGDQVAIWCKSSAMVEELSVKLWGIEDIAFVPHDTRVDGTAPIKFSFDADPGTARFHYCIEGNLPEWPAPLERVSIMFDAASEQQRNDARSAWKRYKASGHVVKFWQQDGNNRWQDQAAQQQQEE